MIRAMALAGTRALMRKGELRIRPGRVLDPVDARSYSYEQRDAPIAEVRGEDRRGSGRLCAMKEAGVAADAMKLEGSLAERDVPDLVQALAERRWTGLVTLTHMGVGKSLTLQEGRLVFASSSSPDDRLGELLLRRGRITLRQYVDAGKAVSPGKRLGAILVEQGALSPKDLVRAVVEQTQEIIYGTFQWIEGHYRLQAQADFSESITLKMSTPDLILEGIRRIEAWSRVRRGIGGLEAEYVRDEGYEKVLAQASLSLEKLSLLTELNGTKDVESICKSSSLPDFETCRTLWAFRVIGAVRRVDKPAAPKPEVEDEGLGFVLTEE